MVAKELDREELVESDPQLNEYFVSTLHHMAATDTDLEIRMLSRSVLGTFDCEKNELDLTKRETQIRTAEEKFIEERGVFIEESEGTSQTPSKTFVVNPNPEVNSAFNRTRNLIQ